MDCTTCPQKQVKDISGKDFYLDGCCMPGSTCGIRIDFSKAPLNGPKLGCVPPKAFNPDAGASKACTPSGQPIEECPQDAGSGG